MGREGLSEGPSEGTVCRPQGGWRLGGLGNRKKRGKQIRKGREAIESLDFILSEMGSHWKVCAGQGCNLMWVLKRITLASGGENSAEAQAGEMGGQAVVIVRLWGAGGLGHGGRDGAGAEVAGFRKHGRGGISRTRERVGVDTVQ